MAGEFPMPKLKPWWETNCVDQLYHLVPGGQSIALCDVTQLHSEASAARARRSKLCRACHYEFVMWVSTTLNKEASNG